MLKQIIFGEGQKVMQIDIETLERSADYRNPNQNKFPASHFDVISEITDMLEEKDIPFEIDDVWITEKGTIPGTKKQIDKMNKRILKDNPKTKDEDLVHINDTEITIIREVICSIKVLGEFENEDMGLVIGFNQNDKGLVFGMGVRVKICSNFTIMGANDTFKNYGKDSVPYDTILELIERRIENIESFWKEQAGLIKALMSITINVKEEVPNIVGDLLLKAVKSAYIETSTESPLNIGDVSKLATTMVQINAETLTAWELYNHITEITSSSTRLEARILQSAATGRYFMERYGIEGLVTSDSPDADVEQAESTMKDDIENVDGKLFDKDTGEELNEDI